MALDDFFPQLIALSPTGGIVPNAQADVFAASDTEMLTPIAITDVNGLPLAKLVASPDGVYPQFKTVGDVFQVKVRSGTLVTEHNSLYWLVQAVGLDPDTVAEAIASRYLSELAAEAAETARAAAVAAAAEAEAAAGVVFHGIFEVGSEPTPEDDGKTHIGWRIPAS